MIWKFLAILIRQNGQVVGHDVAELLLEDSNLDSSRKKEDANTNTDGGSNPQSVNESEYSITNDPSQSIPKKEKSESKKSEEHLSKFRNLLLYGRQEDALESAIENQLWGHALVLASRISEQTHTDTMMKFARNLKLSDPLQTAYQYLSGNVPQAVYSVREWTTSNKDSTSSSSPSENWKNWRPHLAMMIANSRAAELNVDPSIVAQHKRALNSTGDSLSGTDNMKSASHLCYMLSNTNPGAINPFDVDYQNKLVLIGKDHTKTDEIFESRSSLLNFANYETIMMGEIWEYALALGKGFANNQNVDQVCFDKVQLYKLILAAEYCDRNKTDKAMKYVEVLTNYFLGV